MLPVLTHTAILPKYMRIGQAVTWSGIGRSRLYVLLSTGAIRAKKFGATTLIETESVSAYLDSLPDAGFGHEEKKAA